MTGLCGIRSGSQLDDHPLIMYLSQDMLVIFPMITRVSQVKSSNEIFMALLGLTAWKIQGNRMKLNTTSAETRRSICYIDKKIKTLLDVEQVGCQR